MWKVRLMALGLLVALAGAPALAVGQTIQGRQEAPPPPAQLAPAPPGQPPQGERPRIQGRQESPLPPSQVAPGPSQGVPAPPARRPDDRGRDWRADHWGYPGSHPGWRPYAWGPWYDPYYPYYPYYYPYPYYSPPAPVWVPGQWVWNGWQWVWQPGYWHY